MIYPIGKRLHLQKIRNVILEDINLELYNRPEIKFDKDENYINFKNGLYDLKTGNFQKHTPEHKSTFQLDINYNSKAEAPNFKNALNVWFDNERDKEEYLKGLYYSISGNRGAHVALFFYGEGCDGKGEASKVLSSIVGEKRTTGLRLENLDEPHMVASLHGSWINIADDVGAKKHINDGTFKAITGDGLILVNPKYKQPFSIRSKAVWIVLTNHMFSSSDNSRGFNRRIKFINFQRVPNSVKIPYFFEEKLKPELEGIVQYILKNGRELWERDGGFKETPTDRETKSELEERHSVNGFWIDALNSYVIDEKEGEFTQKDERPFEAITVGKHVDCEYLYINKFFGSILFVNG